MGLNSTRIVGFLTVLVNSVNVAYIISTSSTLHILLQHRQHCIYYFNIVNIAYIITTSSTLHILFQHRQHCIYYFNSVNIAYIISTSSTLHILFQQRQHCIYYFIFISNAKRSCENIHSDFDFDFSLCRLTKITSENTEKKLCYQVSM